jgi:hypothetical protein
MSGNPSEGRQAVAEHEQQDAAVAEHERTFQMFVRFWVYVFILSALVLIFLALFNS